MTSTDPHAETIQEIGHLPGTEILFDNNLQGSNGLSDLRHLKSHAKGNSRLLQVPQPSLDDPNDPLSWPAWKKHVTLFNGCWYAFMASLPAAGRIAWASSLCLCRHARALCDI
jgi:hypothetical protein